MSAPHKRLNFVGLVCGFLLCASALAGGAGPVAQPVWPTFETGQPCAPEIVGSTLKLGTQASAAASAQMKAIFGADQADRQGEIDWIQLNKRDLARQQAVLKLVSEGKLSTGQDLLGAAFVFQHGSCSNHYLLANALAKAAISRGNEDAKWLSAATLDRYLLNEGKPQKYGTQYGGDPDGCHHTLDSYDPKTTDAERLALNVPPLAEAKASADRFNAPTCPK